MSQVSLEGSRSTVCIYTVLIVHIYIVYTVDIGTSEVYVYGLGFRARIYPKYVYICLYIYFFRPVVSRGRRRAPQSIKSSFGVCVLYVAGVVSRGILHAVGSQYGAMAHPLCPFLLFAESTTYSGGVAIRPSISIARVRTTRLLNPGPGTRGEWSNGYYHTIVLLFGMRMWAHPRFRLAVGAGAATQG